MREKKDEISFDTIADFGYKTKAGELFASCFLAESEGFEPPDP